MGGRRQVEDGRRGALQVGHWAGEFFYSPHQAGSLLHED